MRERDLRALEFDKILDLVRAGAISEPGRLRVDQLRPSGDPELVTRRLRETAELVELRRRSGALALEEFEDQRGIITAAEREGAVLDGVSLLKLRDFIVAARAAEAFLRSRVEAFPNLAALVKDLLAPRELADALLESLDDGGGLLDDASRELNRLRNRLRAERLDLENRLARSLNAPGMEPFVSDYVVTVRNRRFVLALKPNYAERLEGIVQDRSVSGETLFVEPMWAVELNNRLMMLGREVEAEEYRILARLSAMVRGYAAALRLTFQAMVALDALNARAIFAERFRCVEPALGEAGLELIEARHPLLLTTGREVVPIDVRVAPEQQGIVISGPNTGGKTVALKTIGLLALMGQSGLLIPVREGSRITVFRSIFADIGDEQSIVANLSSFAAHIKNLTGMVEELREPALVILDEPGAGTDPVEGTALAIALMDYFGARRCLLAVSTHSTALKLHAYSRAGFEAAAVDFDAERLLPLFRLKARTIGQSYGLEIAERLGLAHEIIRAAKAVLPAGSAELARALSTLETERRRLVEEREAVARREREAAERERQAAAAAEEARSKTISERERLRAEVTATLEDLKRRGDALLAEIKVQAKSRGDLSRFVADALKQAEPPGETPARAAEGQEPLKVGDQVEFGDLKGELLMLQPGRAVIGRGGLRIEVAPERLRRARAAASRTATRAAMSVTATRAEETEVNLIGMRSGEALRRLEEFLDRAYLANQSRVRIIHGIGSGALKKAVHEYLATSPYCATFFEADPHQGGAGATIVELGL